MTDGDVETIDAETLQELRLRKRIHEVLNLWPGQSVGAMHHLIRAYGTEWRALFEVMVKEGAIRREKWGYGDRIIERYYSTEPLIIPLALIAA